MNKAVELYEFRMAEKEGELSRCEKVLSEVRGMLSEKIMGQNMSYNNFSNEMSVMSDRVQILEKEKGELMDKYSKYGEEFKGLLAKEKDSYESHFTKLK